jgi:hypothetical protein
MANYDPPTENITSFNTLLFNQPEVQLTRGEADLLYLSKVSTDISTAGSTTFNGQVSVGGSLVVLGSTTNTLSTVGINSNYTSFAGLTTASQHNFIVYNNTNSSRSSLIVGFTAVTVENTALLNARQIKSTLPSSSGIHTLFDNMFSGSTLTIGASTSTNTIQGATTIPSSTTIGTNAGSNVLNLKGEQRYFDTASPYTSYAKINTIGTDVIYESPNVASTSHIFKIYTSGTVLTTAFECNPTQNVSRLLLTLTNRLNFASSSSYSFPFSSNLSLGYYLKATGTAQSITTATPTSILTTASIPVGVWRIDFSVINEVGASGAGTISSAQSFVSATNNGAVATAVDFTGSVVRSHVSEVYSNNDIQEITSSFTYNQSTAGVLYLNIVRSFSTGTYLFTGELSITRLA